LPGFDKPQERLWQVPIYLRGTQRGNDAPALFCYYVIRPGEDEYVTGLYVGDEDAADTAAVFEEAWRRKFAHITQNELNACLDEATAVAEEVFAEKDRYRRTADTNHCRNCHFKRVCERAT
jgi:hypothetical protein